MTGQEMRSVWMSAFSCMLVKYEIGGSIPVAVERKCDVVGTLHSVAAQLECAHGAARDFSHTSTWSRDETFLRGLWSSLPDSVDLPNHMTHVESSLKPLNDKVLYRFR